MENFGKHAPCTDKNCGFCCDPVKINKKAIINGFDLPKDKNGNELWEATGDVLAPEHRIETDRVVTFACKNFDKETNKCLDYENRPEVCRDTTCIKDKKGNIDEQHKIATEIKFVKIK